MIHRRENNVVCKKNIYYQASYFCLLTDSFPSVFVDVVLATTTAI